MKYLLILICSLAVISGCRSERHQAVSPQHESRLLRNQFIEILGEEREYHLYLPEDPSSAPMVFLFHGNRGSSDQILGLTGQKAPHKKWLDIALWENLLLVVPNGSIGRNGHQGWNDCRSDAQGNPETDDVHFISSLIEGINNDYQRTETEVFVVGISNGGMMSMRLAHEIPDKLVAFAAIVASNPVNSDCVDSNIPISALIMNGTADPITPYSGGQIQSERGEVYSTKETVDYWVNRNQANRAAVVTELPDKNQDDDSTVKVYSYPSVQNKSSVVYYEIVGGGHTEPSISERYSAAFKVVVGAQNGDIEAADEIWKFFKAQ